MSLVRIIRGSETTFRKTTTNKRYIVPPLSESEVTGEESPVIDGIENGTNVEDMDFAKELDKVLTADDPALKPSEDNTLVDMINGMFKGDNSEQEECEPLSISISLAEIVEDEWSKP